MEEIDKTLFSEGGTAQGAYLPYQPLHMLPPSDDVRDCAQHSLLVEVAGAAGMIDTVEERVGGGGNYDVTGLVADLSSRGASAT